MLFSMPKFNLLIVLSLGLVLAGCQATPESAEEPAATAVSTETPQATITTLGTPPRVGH